MGTKNKHSFKKGNQVAKKGERFCANYPFCTNRIDTNEYPNQKYCCPSCKQYAWIYRKKHKLVYHKQTKI